MAQQRHQLHQDHLEAALKPQGRDRGLARLQLAPQDRNHAMGLAEDLIRLLAKLNPPPMRRPFMTETISAGSSTGSLAYSSRIKGAW